MILFADLSSNNWGLDGIDWPTFARWLLATDPNAGVIIKLVEGLDYVNPYFEQMRDGAEAAGIQNIGYYDFLRPSQGSGADHADFYYATINKFGGEKKNSFRAGDLEDTKVPANADLDAFTLDWDGRMSRPAGYHTVFYSGSWYTVPHNLTRDKRLADMGLWWCAPGAAPVPPTPEPWRSAGKGILLWQYSWHGSVPGIQGDVDLDWLVGGIETLRPFQMGYQPDPLAGKPVNTTRPSVVIPANSESTTDANTVALATLKLVDDLAAKIADPGLKGEAQTAAANLDEIIKATWGR